jgi:hypothetical protein
MLSRENKNSKHLNISPDKKNFFISQVTGETLLHLAVRSCKDPDDLEFFISVFKSNVMQQMSMTVNNKGLIPYQLVSKLPLKEKEKIQIYNVLIKTLPYPKNMSDLIDFEDIKKRYQPKPGTDLYKYLEVACVVVNDVRRQFKKSNSHPQVYGLPIKEINEIKEEIERLYNKIDDHHKIIIDDYIKNDTTETEFYNQLLNSQINLYSDTGNCVEQSYAAFKHLKDKKIPNGLYYVKNGDHAFPIIDPENHQVLCDAWSGKVCPGHAIASELDTHITINNISVSDIPTCYNAITSFNPSYHSIFPIPLFGVPNFTKNLNQPLELPGMAIETLICDT